MTTIEMNIVIQEFDGMHYMLEYDTNWHYLIPAWFKCQAIIRTNPDYRKYDSLFYGAMRRESIEECHKVVYDFIIEYKKKEK